MLYGSILKEKSVNYTKILKIAQFKTGEKKATPKVKKGGGGEQR